MRCLVVPDKRTLTMLCCQRIFSGVRVVYRSWWFKRCFGWLRWYSATGIFRSSIISVYTLRMWRLCGCWVVALSTRRWMSALSYDHLCIRLSMKVPPHPPTDRPVTTDRLPVNSSHVDRVTSWLQVLWRVDWLKWRVGLGRYIFRNVRNCIWLVDKRTQSHNWSITILTNSNPDIIQKEYFTEQPKHRISQITETSGYYYAEL